MWEAGVRVPFFMEIFWLRIKKICGVKKRERKKRKQYLMRICRGGGGRRKVINL